jgi:hypothetical protein
MLLNTLDSVVEPVLYVLTYQKFAGKGLTAGKGLLGLGHQPWCVGSKGWFGPGLLLLLLLPMLLPALLLLSRSLLLGAFRVRVTDNIKRINTTPNAMCAGRMMARARPFWRRSWLPLGSRGLSLVLISIMCSLDEQLHGPGSLQ